MEAAHDEGYGPHIDDARAAAGEVEPGTDQFIEAFHRTARGALFLRAVAAKKASGQ